MNWRRPWGSTVARVEEVKQVLGAEAGGLPRPDNRERQAPQGSYHCGSRDQHRGVAREQGWRIGAVAAEQRSGGRV